MVELRHGDDDFGGGDAAICAEGVGGEALAGFEDEEVAFGVEEQGAGFGEARGEEGVFPAGGGGEFVGGFGGDTGAGGRDGAGLAGEVGAGEG